MTETIINLRYLAESQPSLCIPRVFNNITEARIRQVFDDLGLGKISRIDIKERKSDKGETFKRVYVHFDKWFWNEDAQAARRKLISGKEVKIVYDNPWFWKVSASKWAPTSDSQDRGPQRSRAHIDFEEEPRSRVTDEFGRDLKLKKEHEEHRSRDDSRDTRRADNRRQDTRRRDDSRERRRPERRDDSRERRRPERCDDSRERRRPEPKDDRRNAKDDRRNAKDSRAPIAPTLVRKSEKQEKVVARSPSSSPPRRRDDNPDTLTPECFVKVEYGNIMPPIRKRKFGGITKKATPELVEQVVERVTNPTDELEEGEVVEEQGFVGLSEEDKKACDELYGDFV
jgi:hypothetical protein